MKSQITVAAAENVPGSHEVPAWLEEMARLLESAPSPAQFHAKFMQRVLDATKAAGGAIWGVDQDRFELQYQVNLNHLDLDKEHGNAAHAQLLRQAAQRGRALWVPPSGGPNGGMGAGNPTAFGLMLAPIVVDQHLVGLVEIWFDKPLDLPRKRGLARLLTEVSGFLAAYCHKTQWRSLINRQELLTQVELFARQIHASLDPLEVAHLVANEGRRLCQCDQVSVALRWGNKTRIEAVSGAPGLEKRSRLVQAMRALCQSVLTWGPPVVYQGSRDESLPPDVAKALDVYLAESNSTFLIVQPLRDAREASGQPGGAALLVETFGKGASAEQVQGALEMVVPHATTALYNAAAMRRLPFQWLTRLGSAVQDSVQLSGLKTVLLAGLVAGVISLFWLIRVPLRMEAKGQVFPQQRQVVFAALTGKIVELKVKHGDMVEKGQELLFMEDLETQLQVDQLALKATAAEQRLALLSEQLGKSLSNEERNALTKERINQEFELQKAMVERDILLHGSNSPRKAPVPAPLAGKVITFDAQEQLLGKTVKPGDPLLRIARPQGPWEIELHIPEGNLAAIREALGQTSEGFVEVDFLLASQPQRAYKGRLFRDGLGGETTLKDNAVVLPARVRLEDPELASQLDSLPVGGEVHAKVRCGSYPIGYVWFHELWEFLYERVLF